MSYARNLARLARTGAPTVDTAQALRDMPIYGGLYPERVETLGALAAGDGGGGAWRWDPDSTADDNTGTVLLPTGHVGAGRWVRDYSGAINARWFGFLPAQSPADNDVAIASALAAGNVFVPAGAYSISRRAEIPENGRTLFGEVASTVLIQTGTDEHCDVIYACGLSDVTVRDLACRPGTTSDNYGCGVHLEQCARGLVLRVTTTQHRKGAVRFTDCTDSTITFCQAHDSVVNPEVDSHIQAGVDFYLANNCKNCRIVFNSSNQGCGTGAAVQTRSDVTPEVATDNIIAGNTIEKAPIYGIMAYAAGYNIDDLSRIIIANNTIDTVYGNIESGSTGTKPFGTGIYVKTSEDTLVIGNTIRNVCVNTDTFNLSQGCIGTQTGGDCSIIGNICVASVREGIDIKGYLAQRTDTVTMVANNRVINAGRNGINCSNWRNVSITGNVIKGAAVHGVNLDSASENLDEIAHVAENTIFAPALHGVAVQGGKDITVQDNTIVRPGGAGIAATDAARLEHVAIDNNKIRDATTFGIAMDVATVSGGRICNNIISSTGANLRVQAPVEVRHNQLADGTVSGAYAGKVALGASTTPAVIAHTLYEATEGQSVTAFASGNIGDRIVITASGACVTLVHSDTTLFLNARVNYTMGIGDSIDLYCDAISAGTRRWRELSRTVRA